MVSTEELYHNGLSQEAPLEEHVVAREGRSQLLILNEDFAQSRLLDSRRLPEVLESRESERNYFAELF